MFTRVDSVSNRRPSRPTVGPNFFVGVMVATPLGLALWAVIVWSIWWLLG